MNVDGAGAGAYADGELQCFVMIPLKSDHLSMISAVVPFLSLWNTICLQASVRRYGDYHRFVALTVTLFSTGDPGGSTPNFWLQ
jgi:hypothetical protein